MTAPLAGALLFISQTQVSGRALTAVYPGFLGWACLYCWPVFWGHERPKAGHWMNQIKGLFAFIMLALALYFYSAANVRSRFTVVILSFGHGFVAPTRTIPDFLASHWVKMAVYPVSALAVPDIAYSQYQHSERFLSAGERK